jgi:hypothetical protein
VARSKWFVPKDLNLIERDLGLNSQKFNKGRNFELAANLPELFRWIVIYKADEFSIKRSQQFISPSRILTKTRAVATCTGFLPSLLTDK